MLDAPQIQAKPSPLVWEAPAVAENREFDRTSEGERITNESGDEITLTL